MLPVRYHGCHSTSGGWVWSSRLGSYLPFSVPTLGQLRGSADLRGALRRSWSPARQQSLLGLLLGIPFPAIAFFYFMSCLSLHRFH